MNCLRQSLRNDMRIGISYKGTKGEFMDILQKLKGYRKKIWLFFLLTVFLCGACRAAYVTGARSGSSRNRTRP